MSQSSQRVALSAGDAQSPYCNGLADLRELGCQILLLMLGVAAMVVLFVYDPASAGFYPSCPFRTLTGWQCPGCGSLRGLHQLLRGNFLDAFRLNPLMVVALPVVGSLWAANSWRELRSQTPIAVRIPSSWIWAFVLITCVFWVLRNVVA
jgi:hypothetical protein